ncbi:MAG: ATP-binding protein [Phenylobacterium sp.]|uniref:ATP-binding protein n=1 Tax=Phenylobacterium sp. TaxID=1871053 RepID=UPI00391C454E
MPRAIRLGRERPRRTPLLETKIVVIVLIATMAALTCTFSIYQYRNWTADLDDLAADQLAAGRVIAGLADEALRRDDARLAAEALAVFRATEHATAASYVAADGRRLDFRRDENAVPPSPSGVAAAQARRTPEGVEIRIPHFERGRRVGELVLLGSHAELLRFRIVNILTAIGLSAAGTLGSGWLARRMVRRALRPLHALDEVLEAVAASRDFDRAVEVTSDDEVGRLARNFNGLLEALRDYDASLNSALAEAHAARDAAEEASLLKSRFLANMSHEVRTPLNGIIGMAQAMALEGLDHRQRERLAVIEASGSALLSVLNDVLDISRIEAGRLQLEEAPFEVAEIAEGGRTVFAAAAAAKGLEFALFVEPGVEGRWMGDSARVRQVLYNLASNAVKFTERGRVEVRVAPVEGQGLALVVSDTGVGVAPDLVPRLFGRFEQGDGGVTRQFGGAGLGLALCHDIVGLMGGRMEVESELGRGSTFRAILPLARAEAPAGTDDKALAWPLRVLVAEDNPTNQLVVTTILAAFGIEPLIAENGEAAVQAWEQGTFDLVFMDIQMPVLDGVSAVREIRRREAALGRPRTRIVALTAHAMPHQVAEYVAAGMDGHLAKPILMDKLIEALNAAAPAAKAA